MKESRTPPDIRTAKPIRTFAPFFQLQQFRKLRECEQVSAICYRMCEGEIQFLLVQTSGGRWTFPKGNAESGLTHAQAAALEAFEEAGVHGRIEEKAFARYTLSAKRNARTRPSAIVTVAHLCEVYWQESPKERGRSPSWFSLNKARKRLCERRNADDAGELTRVLQSALVRVRAQKRQRQTQDPLQKVHFIDKPRPISGRLKASLLQAQRNEPDILPPIRTLKSSAKRARS